MQDTQRTTMTETPKEFIGRTMRKRTTVIGEASGNYSYKPRGPKSVTLALSETDRADEFIEISKKYPWNTRGTHDHKELKWVSSSDEIRKAVLKDINDLSPDIFVATDERNDVGLDMCDRHQALLRVATEELLNKTNAGHLDFVMDQSPFIKEGRGRTIVKEIIGNRDITYSYKHVVSEKSNLVQTQDFVAGAANKYEVSGDRQFIGNVEKKIISWKRVK